MKAKNVILFLLMLFSMAAVGQGSVTVAATNGGSVTFTPDGVFRSEPKMKGATKTATPPRANAPRATNRAKTGQVDTVKVVNYPINDIGLEEAKLIRNNLASVAYEENPNETDWKAFLDLRTFVIANRDFKNSNKKLSIQVSEAMMERILQSSSWYSGSYSSNSTKEIQDQYDRAMRSVNLRKKVIDQGEAEEKKRKVKDENSKIKRYKNQFNE